MGLFNFGEAPKNNGSESGGENQPEAGEGTAPYAFRSDRPSSGFLAAIASETTVVVSSDNALEHTPQEPSMFKELFGSALTPDNEVFVETATSLLIEAGYEQDIARHYALGMVIGEEEWQGGVVPHPTTAAGLMLDARAQGYETRF